jgi:hypothetical protein
MNHKKLLGPRFIHRANRDGTIGSFCRVCFVTVAIAGHETNLEKSEQDHVCDPWKVERYRKCVTECAERT